MHRIEASFNWFSERRICKPDNKISTLGIVDDLARPGATARKGTCEQLLPENGGATIAERVRPRYCIFRATREYF